MTPRINRSDNDVKIWLATMVKAAHRPDADLTRFHLLSQLY